MRTLARSPDQRLSSAHGLALALEPMVGAGGRDAVVKLMSRLFDASREREERAAMLIDASGRIPRVSHAELPAIRSEEPRKRKTGRSLTPVPREPTTLGTGTAPSATALVSRNARWLKRFGLVFAPVLASAIAFNVLMTRHLESQSVAQTVSAPTERPAAPQPQALPAPTTPPAPVQAAAAPVAEKTAAPAPPPEAAHTAPAQAALPASTAAKAAALPETRPQPETSTRRSSASTSADAKKALDEARTAFESDDFTRAIKRGREALELGEGRAHAILGAAYYKIGRFEEAVRSYKEALRLDPHNPSLEKRVELARRAATGNNESEP
jgi:Flp pilus assembly protein TadD